MTAEAPASPGDGRPLAGIAFMLAQLGAHAAERYATRVAALDLTPAHTGLLRMAAIDPGLSQQVLAGRLGALPSKIVGLVDDLEKRGLVERRRNPDDRRNHALHLTEAGHHMLAEIARLALLHEADITAALDDDQRHRMAEGLLLMVEQQGLRPGVHPGYRNLRPARRDDRPAAPAA